MSTHLVAADWIWKDGEYIPWADAKVHVLSLAVQFGSSVFEGVRCYDTPDGPAIFRLPDHLRRLRDSCRIYRMELPHTQASLTDACRTIVRRNALTECYLRPTVLRGYGAAGMNPVGSPIETYIAAWAWGAYLGAEALEQGVDVCVSSWQRPEPNTYPSNAKAAGHYTNAQLIKMEAVANGYVEAIALGPGGVVSEGSGQNLFLVRDGMLVTPQTDGTSLTGITRDSVMVIARDLGLEVREMTVPREMLYTAEEAFFTGTASEVTPIRSVDKISIGAGKAGPVTKQLQDRFLAHARGQIHDKHGWLTRVGQIAKAAVSLAAFALTLGAPWAAAQQVTPDRYGELPFRHIGPVGNRVSAVAGVPGDRMTYYAGAASGGIWKTEDGGLQWKPIFDDQPVHSIGSLAVSPSDAAVVWAGTGESFIRSNVSIGNGVWKSTDRGETWTHMGLQGTGRIGRVIVHPTNSDIVYAAALGHGYSPQQERGVYRTTDGGTTWQRVLFVDERTGAGDIAMDPNNPRILYAGMWQLNLKTWVRESGGPGSGLFVSRDGGDSWKRLEGNGLPKLPVGKIAVCMSRANSRRVYALIETGDGVPREGEETESGELWRSDDGGKNWMLVSHDRDLAGRSAYYSRCAVSPDDPDEAYFLSASFSVTLDGGKTNETRGFFATDGGPPPGWDHHDMWIDGTDGDRMIVGHDGGISISENRSTSWFRVQLPVAQMYHVTVDTKVPYYVYGNRQDGPSMRGPSNARIGGLFGQGIPRGMWHAVGGGESGFATPDPVDPDVIWSSASGAGAGGGIVVRYDERTRQFRHVEVWPEGTFGWPAESLKYRFQWTFPLLISPHDRHTVYVTSQHVHRTRNGGQSWEVVSPDLTTNDKSRQGISGGLTPDNLGVEYCCVIYAFDESPVQPGVLWAGTNDGLVHVSRDSGRTWTNVTGNLPDLPPDGVVRNIDASRWSAGKAYLTVEHHQVGIFEPFVYKTVDFGRRWTKITNGIGPPPVNYARHVREDPVRPGLLYLGTESTLYVSFDDGANWQPLMTNLPHTPMYWLAVQEHFNDLVVGTYGRGFWILDDLTPLQQLTAEVAAERIHLFQPRDAYRFQPITEPMTMLDDPSAGQDPEYGASLNYWLTAEPEGDVKLHLLDAGGDTVRTLDGTKKVGINRVWWNLRGELSPEIKLRTKPLHADWVELGEKRWRSADGGRFAILQPPGTYTVVLSVDGVTLDRQLRVLKDPNTEGSEADIAAQVALLHEVRTDLTGAAEAVNRIELIRRQLYDLRAVVEERDGMDSVVAAATALDEKLITVEEHLYQLRITGTGQDGVRWPSKLVGRLGYLAGVIATADFPPTDQQREVHALLRERLARAQAALDALLSTDVPAFNRMLQERNVNPVIADP